MKLKKYSQQDILNMEKFYRRNFCNTLAGFKSANLIGTVDNSGNTNLAVFNSVVHIGATPPYMGFILRPTTVPRHTYENIKETEYYTFNHINKSFVKEAHYTSAKFDKGVSEFDHSQLQTEYSETHKAPYVVESKLKIGLKYVEEHLIKANNTILVIGEVIEVILNEEIVHPDGFIHLDQLDTVAISGLDAYYSTDLISRFSYARPEEEIHELE